MSVDIYGYFVYPEDLPVFTEAQANFSNTNARMVCEYLGLPFDATNWAGSWPVEEVKSRCVLARAVGGNLGDEGMPPVRDGGPGTGRPTMIECGLRPGYFADAVAAIERVVDECIARGMEKVSYA